MKLHGRRKIFTDEKEITRNNIIDVLLKSYAIHRLNSTEIQFLIDYERGSQPLKREKTIRPEIDIRISSNIPNVVKDFKLGYNWSGQIMLVQRGDSELHGSDSRKDDEGITALNEIMRNAEDVGAKDLRMAEFLEICGIGHKMVDERSDFTYTESLFCDYDLDSRYAFCVYHNGVGQTKLMGVTFVKSGNKLKFTCFTKKSVFEISSWEIKDERPNTLGMVNIIEFERSTDRTGCFERSIPEIDALNIEMSDFSNSVSEQVQQIWWGNDITFPTDESGKVKKPVSGQWLLTYSGEGKQPKVQPIIGTLNETNTLTSIGMKRKTILQDCKVPIQYETSGTGNTGTSTDMASGWSAAELDANRQQQIIERGKREELRLIIKAIEHVPTSVLPLSSPIRNVHASDVDFHFNRRKNYDMAVKANTFATYIKNGVHGRHALKVIDAFEDTEQVWNDSKDNIEKYQKTLFEQKETRNVSDEKIMSDTSDQAQTSPIIDGMNTNQGGDN